MKYPLVKKDIASTSTGFRLGKNRESTGSSTSDVAGVAG